MTVDRSFVTQNDKERARLRALVSRSSDADLARAMPAEWTVASVLAHLAFWDQRFVLLLERWRQPSSTLPRPIDEADVNWINDATKPMLLALPPRRAADLALAIAEAADQAAASLTDDLLARLAAAGNPVNLLRAEHRREHLDEIEHLLGSQ